jgi:predicted amidophosphoribosyltransferase
MSLELHWTCDGCGRREVGGPHEFPKGWCDVRGRQITHHCADCASPKANSGFIRQVHYWCLRNPALTMMMSTCVLLLAVNTAGGLLCALHLQRMNARIAELERSQEVIPERIPSPGLP